MKTVTMYTDGACRHNPGPGGWGVWFSCDGQEQTLRGGEKDTTNNRMELMAAIMGLRILKHSCIVNLYTDSQYVQKGIKEWIIGWQRRNWRTSTGQLVKNQDLWQSLLVEAARHQVHWHWVKAHVGNIHNERADSLARQAIDELL